MGAFTVLRAINVMPRDGESLNKQKMETVAVKKYDNSLVQRVLAAHIIKIIHPLHEHDYGSEKVQVPMLLCNAPNGIKHFEIFFPELHQSINIVDFDKVFANAMKYLRNKVKHKFFILDTSQYFGMGDETPKEWMYSQRYYAKECQETLKGAKYMFYRSSISSWLKTDFAAKDISHDIAWLNAPNKTGW